MDFGLGFGLVNLDITVKLEPMKMTTYEDIFTSSKVIMC